MTAKAAKHLQMLLTVDQVAALTQLSRRQVQRLVQQQAFASVVYVTETDLRIPADAFAEFVEHRSVRRVDL